MKEQRSVSKDKLINVEIGLPHKEEHLCAEVVKANNGYRTTVLCVKLILYLALLLLIGWSCYLIWQMPRIRVMEVKGTYILQETKFQSLLEQELIPDRNMNLSASSSDGNWNERVNNDTDIINKIENVTVLPNVQDFNMKDATTDSEKSGIENILSDKSELNARSTEQDNIDASSTKILNTTPLLFQEETTSSESTASSLSSDEYDYDTFELNDYMFLYSRCKSYAESLYPQKIQGTIEHSKQIETLFACLLLHPHFNKQFIE